VSEVLKADVLEGLGEALEAVAGLRVEVGDELEGGKAQLPLAQVYWLRSGPRESETDRNTFAGQGTPQRWLEWVVRIDLYAQEGRFFGQAYGAMLTLQDAIEDALEAGARQNPCFGVAGVRNVGWTSEFATFAAVGSTEPGYVGSRFELTCRIW